MATKLGDITLEKVSGTTLTLQTKDKYVDNDVSFNLSVTEGSTAANTASADADVQSDTSGRNISGVVGTKSSSAPSSGYYLKVKASGSGSSKVTTAGWVAEGNLPAASTTATKYYPITTATVTQNAPTINSSGLVTATTTTTAGYTPANATASSNTLQLSTQAGKTVIPTESEQTAVASGKYTTGAVKVAGIAPTYVGSGVTRNDSDDLSANGPTVTAPAGYYEEDATKTISSGSVTPAVNSHLITTNPVVTSSTTGTITDISTTTTPSGTDGVNYWTITPSGSVTTTGVSTANAKATVNAGYIASSPANSDNDTVDILPTVAAGETRYIKKGSTTQNAPTINTSTGVVTATSTVAAGYQAASTPSNTLSLSTQAGRTVAPTESEQTAVAAYKYTTGAVKVGAISKTYVGSNIARNDSESLSVSGATVTVPAGYYAENASASVANGSVTQNAPTIDSATGKVTATSTVTAGYVSASPPSNTLQLSTQDAATITPGTSNKTAVAAGKYTTGAVTVAGDADLTAVNIKKGIDIFGVTGTFTTTPSGKTALTAAALRSGYAGFINGNQVNGSMADTTITEGTTTVSSNVATRGTWSQTAGYTAARTIDAATFANSATTGKTYVDISSTPDAPVLVSGGYLYINKGYTDDLKISLAKLVPDGASADLASGVILSGYSAYDNNGTLIAGDIPTKTALTVSENVVTAPAGYYAADTSATVPVGTVTSGTATISSVTVADGSDASKFTLSGSANVSAPTVGTAGYISSSKGTKNAKSGGATLSATVSKIVGTASISATTKKPSITKQDVPSGVTQAASGDATTTAPSSGVYVAVKSAANTATLTPTVSISTSGYGTSSKHGITASGATVGAAASDTTYIPIATTTASVSGKTVSYGSGWITEGSKSVADGDYTPSVSSQGTSTAAAFTPSTSGTITDIATTTAPTGTDGTDYWTITPSGSKTNGVARAKATATIGTAGYIAEGSKTTSSYTTWTLTTNVNSGTNSYIPKAAIAGTSTNATATTTVAPGTVSISKQSTPSGVTNAASGNATTTAPSSGVYVAVKATAAANSTGTTSAISGSGSATVSNAGYAPSSLTGSISVSGTATAKTSAKDSSMTYVPITTTEATVSGKTVSYGSGWITEGSKSVATGAVTSGSATINAASYTYNSTAGNFAVSGSADVPAPTVNTNGYVSSTEGTRTAGTATLQATVAKIAGSTAITTASGTGTDTATKKPVITKQDVPSGVTNAAGGDATTTVPSSGVYVAVKSAANTGKLTATPSVSTAGYGTNSNHGITARTATYGAAASDTTYVPIATTSASLDGKTVTYGTGWITEGSLSVEDGEYSPSVTSASVSTAPTYTPGTSGTITDISTTDAPSSGTDGTDYWTITPSGTKTNGTARSKATATISKAGYIAAGSKTTSSYTSKTITITENAGTARYLTKAVIAGSSTNATATTTVAPGTVSISKQSTPTGVTNAASGNATTTAPTSGVYVAVKATAAANSTGTTSAISGSGSATVTTAGYAPSILTGSVTVSGTATAKTSAKDSSMTYVPITTGSSTTPATTITANPTISVSNTGLITASVSGSESITPTVSAGYVLAGTAGTVSVSGSKTSQLTTQAEKTWTPTTTNQTIAAGTYTTGVQTIAGDADLVAANIKKGVEIFGVTGTFTTTPSGKTALAAAALRSGYVGFINGNQVNGSMPDTTVTEGTTTVSSTTATRGTWSQTAGYTAARTIAAATFANSATSGTTYVDISGTTAAPVLVAGNYLYINKGWTDNLKISLAKLVPDGSDVKGHGEYILSGHSAYDNDGTLVAGTIPTIASTDLLVDGKTVTVPVGFYTGASDATAVTASVAVGVYSASVASQGTDTAAAFTPSTTGTITNITTTTAPSGTDGTDYWTITPSGSATTGKARAKSKATISTAGYIPAGSATTANYTKWNITTNVNAGTNSYIPKAAIAGTSTNATATTTVAPGTVSISKQSTPSGVTNAASGNATTTAPSSGVYVAVKATAAANSTGTTSSISGSGTATVATAGYAPTSLTGSVTVSGTATAKTSAKDSSMTYVPITTATPAFDGGALSGTATASSSTATISSTNTSGVSFTTACTATRANVLYNGAVAGWVSKADNATALASTSTALTGTTYYINGVSLTAPSSGTRKFNITIPNGTNDTLTLCFTVDSSGNTTIEEV